MPVLGPFSYEADKSQCEEDTDESSRDSVRDFVNHEYIAAERGRKVILGLIGLGLLYEVYSQGPKVVEMIQSWRK